MILVLDDDPARHKAFRQGLIGAQVVAFRTAPEAIAWLKDPLNPVPTTIFLDHDLDQFGTPASVAGNGMHVAAVIASQRRLVTAHVIVHSVNPLAGPVMARMLLRALRSVDLRPGAWNEDGTLTRAVRRDRGA